MIETQIKLSTGAQELLSRLDKVPRTALEAIAKAEDLQNLLVISQAKSAYMSFPKDQAPSPIGLRVISNRLRSSITASKARISGSQVISGIGSNVVYAAIHEFGGTTAPHEIRPSKGKALAFTIGGKQVFAAVVHHPGSRIPARAPIQRALKDRSKAYGKSVSNAVLSALAGFGGAGRAGQ